MKWPEGLVNHAGFTVGTCTHCADAVTAAGLWQLLLILRNKSTIFCEFTLPLGMFFTQLSLSFPSSITVFLPSLPLSLCPLVSLSLSLPLSLSLSLVLQLVLGLDQHRNDLLNFSHFNTSLGQQ